MSKKEDPRTIRTREMFKQAVLALLQEGTPIGSLTVQKVAQQAGLNRTTFYLHYQDIQDLVAGLTDEILQELTEKVEALIHLQQLSEEKQLMQLLDYLYTQRHHLLVLFQTEQFEAQLFALMKKLIEVRREKSERLTYRSHVASDIKAASIVGIMMWWLRNGLHFSSEYIAEQIQVMYR